MKKTPMSKVRSPVAGNHSGASAHRKANAIFTITAFILSKMLARRGRFRRVEIMFNEGLDGSDGSKLQKAINQSFYYNLEYHPVIKEYILKSREIVSVMMTEAYIIDQLQDAIKSHSVELLKNAIEMAENSNLIFPMILQDAKRVLHNVLHKQNTLYDIKAVLDRSTTISALVDNYDELQGLIIVAVKNRLEDESIIHDTVSRLKNVQKLIEIRDRIRNGIELCSISQIQVALERREQLLFIYGPTFLQKEVIAALRLFKLLQFESQLSPDYRRIIIEGSDDTNSDEEKVQDDNIESQEVESYKLRHSSMRDSMIKNILDNDIKLPIFARAQLEIMKNATTIDEYNEAQINFSALVPNAKKRNGYIRCFKWIVAVAFWKYGNNTNSQQEFTDTENDDDTLFSNDSLVSQQLINKVKSKIKTCKQELKMQSSRPNYEKDITNSLNKLRLNGIPGKKTFNAI